jgi:hypothetical protein
MNTVRRFASVLVGIVTTCLFTAAAASAKVAPFETAAPPRPGGQVTPESSGDGILSVSTLTAIGALLLAVAIAALVARFVATHRGAAPAAHA